MAGGTESNGTGIGEFLSCAWNCSAVSLFSLDLVPFLVNFPLLCLEVGIAFFFRFAGTWKSGSARLLGLLTCALPVHFLFCPVWSPPPLVGVRQ